MVKFQTFSAKNCPPHLQLLNLPSKSTTRLHPHNQRQRAAFALSKSTATRRSHAQRVRCGRIRIVWQSGLARVRPRCAVMLPAVCHAASPAAHTAGACSTGMRSRLKPECSRAADECRCGNSSPPRPTTFSSATLTQSRFQLMGKQADKQDLGTFIVTCCVVVYGLYFRSHRFLRWQCSVAASSKREFIQA